MELRYIHYFIAVAEELNFRRAAERLHVSAPALSLQIKKLENLLGVRLCERDTAKVRLTMPGEIFLLEARELLRRMRNLMAVTKEAAHGKQGFLRIGTPSSFSLSFLPDALNKYRLNFPEVDVQLMEFGLDSEQPDAVQDGRVHVGFVYDCQLQRMHGVDNLLMMDAPVRAVMSARHPLAAGEHISMADLVKYPLLCSKHFDAQCQRMLSLMQEKNLKPKTVKKVQGASACAVMLAAGEGVTLLSAMRNLPLTDKLACRPIKDAASEFRLQIHAVWKNAGLPSQALNFIGLLREAGA